MICATTRWLCITTEGKSVTLYILHSILVTSKKVKVKVTLELATKAQRGILAITLLFL